MKFLGVLVLFALPTHGLAAAESTGPEFLSGSAKLFPLVSYAPGGDALDGESSGVVVGSLRLNAMWSDDQAAFEIAYHLFPIARAGGSSVVAGLGTESGTVAPRPSPLRFVDFNREVTNGRYSSLLQNLDRLLISVFAPSGAELRLGRQAINHGSSRIFPATDIFSPFSPATLDTEFKQGVDALRLTLPVDEASEFEFYAVALDREIEDSIRRGVYLARYRRSIVDRLDVSVLAGTTYGSPTFALDLASDVLGATVYGEAFLRLWDAGTARDLVSVTPEHSAPKRTVRATLGGQYFFSFELDLAVEFHWNGPGSTDRQDYSATALRPEWSLGELYLLGKAYLGTFWSYAATDLVQLSMSTITNLSDASTLVAPSLYWDSTENTSISVGALLGLGRRLSRDFVADEFGLYPLTLYADVRVYF